MLTEQAWELKNVDHAWAMQKREMAQTICKVKHSNIHTLMLFLRRTSLTSREIFCNFLHALKIRHSCGGPPNLIKQLSLLLKIPSSPICPLAKKKLSIDCSKLCEGQKDKKAVLLLLFPKTSTRIKFPVFRRIARIYNSFPQHKHICLLLLPAIVCYPSLVTLDSFQPKLGNRYFYKDIFFFFS